jgi:hypothetical protein
MAWSDKSGSLAPFNKHNDLPSAGGHEHNDLPSAGGDEYRNRSASRAAAQEALSDRLAIEGHAIAHQIDRLSGHRPASIVPEGVYLRGSATASPGRPRPRFESSRGRRSGPYSLEEEHPLEQERRFSTEDQRQPRDGYSFRAHV